MKISNLDGTGREDFHVGKEPGAGLRKVGNQIALYDPVSGAYVLADLIGGGGSSIIETRGILTRAGGMVYTPTAGGVALVVRNP